jgi:hypothetical protein
MVLPGPVHYFAGNPPVQSTIATLAWFSLSYYQINHTKENENNFSPYIVYGNYQSCYGTIEVENKIGH